MRVGNTVRCGVETYENLNTKREGKKTFIATDLDTDSSSPVTT